MLLPADCAVQETPASAVSRTNDKLNQTRVDNFSHSEKAELLPEFVAFNIESLREWWFYAALDAHSCAAAGQKLTLNEDYVEKNCQQRKRAGIAPCPSSGIA